MVLTKWVNPTPVSLLITLVSSFDAPSVPYTIILSLSPLPPTQKILELLNVIIEYKLNFRLRPEGNKNKYILQVNSQR